MPAFRSVIISLLAMSLADTSLVAQIDDVPSVLREWDTRRAVVQTVRYAIKWEEFPRHQRPGEPKLGTNGNNTGTSLVLIDFEKGRLRFDHDGLYPAVVRNKVVRQIRTLRYDGREESTALDINSNQLTGPVEPTHADIRPWQGWLLAYHEVMPLLWGHGIHWTGPDQEASRFPLTLTRTPERYTVTRRETIEGRVCLVLQDSMAIQGSFATLRVDPSRGGAVVRSRVEWPQAVEETHITYRESPEGWFPASWSVHTGAPGEPLRESSRYRVDKIEFNPTVTEEDFRIALRPGLRVQKFDGVFQIADDGALTPLTPPDSQPQQPLDAWGKLDARTKWIATGTLALVLLLIGLFL